MESAVFDVMFSLSLFNSVHIIGYLMKYLEQAILSDELQTLSGEPISGVSRSVTNCRRHGTHTTVEDQQAGRLTNASWLLEENGKEKEEEVAREKPRKRRCVVGITRYTASCDE